MSAADIGHLRSLVQLFSDSGQGRQPVRYQVGNVARTEESLGPLEQAWAVFVPADALAGLECMGDLRLVLEHRRDDVVRPGYERRAPLVGEDGRLLRGHRVLACLVLNV